MGDPVVDEHAYSLGERSFAGLNCWLAPNTGICHMMKKPCNTQEGHPHDPEKRVEGLFLVSKMALNPMLYIHSLQISHRENGFGWLEH